MKTVLNIRNEKGLKDSEVMSAVAQSKNLVQGKTGYRFGRIDNRGYFSGEVERNLHLEINVGHNIYTTNIYLSRGDGLSPAYFCNGRFWMTINGFEVELI
jgi:hypothetical protein